LLDGYLRDNFRDSNKRNEVIAIAAELAAQQPQNAMVAYSYGRYLLFNGEFEKGKQQLGRSLELDKSNLVVWEEFLQLYGAKESADSLSFYADKALRLFPNDASMHFFKGVAQMNKEDYPAAIATFNRVLEMLPDESVPQLARVHSTLGDLYNLTKQYKLS